MAVLGSAYVVIKAITTGLNGDIKKGLDGAAGEAEAAGDRQGRAYATHFGDEAENELRKGFADRLNDVINDALSDGTRRSGRNNGRSLGASLLSGFTGALQGAAGLAVSLTSITTIAVGLAGVIGALVGAIGALAGGLVALIGPLSAVAAAMGVVAVGAIGAFVQAAAVGIGIFSQLKGEIEDLGPQAARVRTLFDGVKDTFGGLFEQVGNAAGGPFSRLGDILETVGGSLFPILAEGIRSTGDAISGILGKFNDLLNNPLFQSDLAQVMSTNSKVIGDLGGGFVNLTDALFSVLAAASPLIERFSSWFQEWTSYISKTAQLGQETGRLGAFFDRAGDIAATFFGGLRDIGAALGDIIQYAGPLGISLFKGFGVAAAGIRAYTESAEGAATITKLFSPTGQLANNFRSLGGIVRELGTSIVSLAQNRGIQQLAEGITAALPGITGVLNAAITAVGTFAQALGAAFQSKAGESGLRALQDGIRNFGDAAARLAPALGPLLQIIGDLVTNLSSLLGPAFDTIVAVLPSLIQPMRDLGQAIGQVLLAAVQRLVPVLPSLVSAISAVVSALTPTVVGVISAIATALQIFANVVGFLAPVLRIAGPAIVVLVTALLGLKATIAIIGGVTGVMRTLSTVAGVFGGGARTAATGATTLATGATGLSRAFTAAGGAIPVAGVALVAYGVAAQQSAAHQAELTTEVTNSLNQLSLLQAQGTTSIDQINSMQEAQRQYLAFYSQLGDNSFLGLGTDFTQVVNDATAANAEYEAGLNPLTVAQQGVTDAQTAYQRAVNESGAGSDEANAAMVRYKAAQVEAARQQGILNGLTGEGARVTTDYAQAMEDARTSIYETFSAQTSLSGAQNSALRAVLQLPEAQDAYNAAVAEFGANSIEAQLAGLDLSDAQNSVRDAAAAAAQAVGDAAIANGEFTSKTAAQAASTQAQIAYLQQLADQATGPTRDALLGLIEDLQTTGRQVAKPRVEINLKEDQINSTLKGVEGKLTDIGSRVVEPQIRASSSQFEARIAVVRDKIEQLKAETVSPNVDIRSSVFDVKLAEIREALARLKKEQAAPTVEIRTSDFDRKAREVKEALAQLALERATPSIDARTSEFDVKIKAVKEAMVKLELERSTPNIDARSSEFEKKIQLVKVALVELEQRRSSPSADLRTPEFDVKIKAVKAALVALDISRAAPSANLRDNASAPISGLGAAIGALNGRSANPYAGLNDQASGRISGVGAAIRGLGGLVANPSVSLIDKASEKIQAIRNEIAAIKDKTVTITTQNLKKGANASGGRIDTDMFSVVGEEGRETVFLSQGSYVATAAQTDRILKAAAIQAGASNPASGGAIVGLATAPAESGFFAPITVNPAPGMNETELAAKTAREFALTYRKKN